MKAYVIHRLLLFIPRFLGALLIVFIITRSLPGDPIMVMAGELDPPSELRERLTRELGLDKPIIVQYFFYLGRVLQGEWGKSVFISEPVVKLTLEKFSATLLLAFSSVAIAASMGIPLGLEASRKRGRLADKVVRTISSLSISAPVFLVGIVLIYIFAVEFKMLPPTGRHPLLPSVTLAIFLLGPLSRVARASMLEAMSQDFVTMARCKGLSEGTILLRYVLRPSLIPIVTVVGLQFGTLLGGAVITETVFAYPGLGKLAVDAIFTRDYPLIQGTLLLVTISMSIVNLVTDIAYALLDPRVRLEARFK